MRASNSFSSVLSPQRTIETNAGVPEGISAPEVTVKSDTAALVCWDPPQVCVAERGGAGDWVGWGEVCVFAFLS